MNTIRIKIKTIIRIIQLKANKCSVSLSHKCNVSRSSSFEGNNKIGRYSIFSGCLGSHTYIGEYTNINGKIGRYCSISDYVTVIVGTHPKYYVSTSPTFYSLLRQNGDTFVERQKFKEMIYADEEQRYGIIVGNDVWISHGATIMGGITIGDGAIVAANALVTKDVPPYAIVAGLPATIIGYRFSKDKIDMLSEIKWWDWSIEEIKQYSDDFDDIERFIKKHNKKCKLSE